MAGSESTRVLVIDPSFLFYHGASLALASSPYQIVGWTQDTVCALTSCKANAIDLALIGHGFGAREGLELCRTLRIQLDEIRIVLLSEHAASALFQEDAFHAGANGCVLPSVSHADFLAALDPVMNGEHPHQSVSEVEQLAQLTPREIEILRLAARDKTDKEIAQTLQISVNTVRNHMQNILRKLEANNREAAIWRAQHRGWI